MPCIALSSHSNLVEKVEERFIKYRVHASTPVREALSLLLQSFDLTSTGTGELRIRFNQFGVVLIEYTENKKPHLNSHVMQPLDMHPNPPS